MAANRLGEVLCQLDTLRRRYGPAIGVYEGLKPFGGLGNDCTFQAGGSVGG